MRKRNALMLIILIVSSLLLTPQSVLASVSSSSQNNNNFKNNSISKLKSMQTSSSLSLFLWTDKDSYYRQENVLATAEFLYNETPISDASVTVEVIYPENTTWFVWTNTTNQEGFSTFEFLLPLGIPSGEYGIYATGYKMGLGNASAAIRFTVTIRGDVNGDGVVNILDVKKVKLAYDLIIVLPSADLNDDDIITGLDVDLVKLIYSGIL